MYWLAPNLGPGLLLVAIVIGFLWTAVGLATVVAAAAACHARGVLSPRSSWCRVLAA